MVELDYAHQHQCRAARENMQELRRSGLPRVACALARTALGHGIDIQISYERILRRVMLGPSNRRDAPGTGRQSAGVIARFTRASDGWRMSTTPCLVQPSGRGRCDPCRM